MDRGNFSMECLMIVLSMKILHPDCVYINRGNHVKPKLKKKQRSLKILIVHLKGNGENESEIWFSEGSNP